MAEWLKQLIPTSTLYVRIRPRWLSVRDATSGRVHEDEPLVAFADGQPSRILTVGRAAASTMGKPGKRIRRSTASCIRAPSWPTSPWRKRR